MKKTLLIKLNLLVLISLVIFGLNTNVYASNPVSKYFTGIKSFRVSFTQKLIEEDNIKAKESSGLLIVQNPDKFYLEYTKPDKLIYVADGKKLWAYDEELEQVIVKSQSNILVNTPAMILSQPQDIEKKYTVSKIGKEEGIVKFRLTPKQKDSTFEYIIIGFIKNDLKILEMIDNFGQHTVLKFNKIEKNPILDSKTFTFVPPEGVDVLTDEGES